jgi:carboxyl-terminal processing protease
MNEYNTEDEERKNGGVSRSFLGVGLAVLLAAAAFFSGLQVGNGALTNATLEAGLFSFFIPSKAQEKADLDEFWRVWELLEEKYVSASSTDEITVEQRIEGAINGLVKSYGDPYTVFMPPSDANMFEEDISGNFGGVGMEVGLRDGVTTVIAPLPDTPATAAGIVAGDVIVEIDAKSTEGMSIDEAVQLIRGEPGTTVSLKLYREGEEQFLDKVVTRAEIMIPTVVTEVKDNVFIISLYSFNAIAEGKMREALSEYAKSGKKKLILDLRGNPGGFLQSAVSIGSYFIPAGKTIVSENFGEGLEDEHYRSQGKTLGEFNPDNMLVLVDGGSASASEILAGALQEHGIAKLLGAQTFGKGSVQELVSLDDGSSLKVTVARWFTPNGVSISKAGLAPDIIVERTPQQVIDNVDPQLDAAIKWLNGDKNVGTTTKKTEAQ